MVSYFDGSGKSRQVLTKIQSDPGYIIGMESIYDFEGRPAIKTLPIPIQAGNLLYQPGITIHATTGDPYTASDFDFGCLADSISPLASTFPGRFILLSFQPGQNLYAEVCP
ncbi:MAG: hypothetical protein KL787_05655 [Taibaiella sp.]|nr:hypothetical protein [Taibaiella sp.]